MSAAAAVVVVQGLPEVPAPVAAQPLVPAPVPHEPELPALAPPVLAEVPVLASWQVVVGLARLPVVAHLVVEAAVPLDLRNRQSSSAAMAGSSP